MTHRDGWPADPMSGRPAVGAYGHPTTKDGSRSKQGWPGCGRPDDSTADHMLASPPSRRPSFRNN